MTAIAIHKSSAFRISTLAGIVAGLTLGISATIAAQPAPSAKSQAPAPTTASSPSPLPQKPLHHWYQLGHASWYGRYFQGHTTASGESYNMYDLTCAHRSLPLGSLIRVTNMSNHRTVVVRVNDRGPVPEDRIVDLSYAAANVLGVQGIAKVRLDLLPAVAQLHWPLPDGQ
ncbi:septal ring lytic transglycosylase RlpA family protein [Acidisarcina polymorpha]|nr:septal ring lytic transglycosylase RlpA family protein [Acidisarcina polymorpha]